MAGIESLARKLAANGLPALATALGGPLAGAAVSAIAKSLHIDEATVEATVEVIQKTIATDPASIPDLAPLDARFAEAAAVQEAAIAPDPADVQRIRAASTWPRMDDMMRTILAFFLVPAPVAVLVLVGIGKFNLTGVDATLLGMLVGYLLGEAKSASQYYFGTSIGSTKKQTTIDDLNAENAKRP